MPKHGYKCGLCEASRLRENTLLKQLREANERADKAAHGQLPFTCLRCDDGRTGLYCLNCAELLLSAAQPDRGSHESVGRKLEELKEPR